MTELLYIISVYVICLFKLFHVYMYIYEIITTKNFLLCGISMLHYVLLSLVSNRKRGGSSFYSKSLTTS